MKKEDLKYCSITEQGDLGLGAQVLCESDQEIMKKNNKNKFDSDKETQLTINDLYKTQPK